MLVHGKVSYLISSVTLTDTRFELPESLPGMSFMSVLSPAFLIDAILTTNLPLHQAHILLTVNPPIL